MWWNNENEKGVEFVLTRNRFATIQDLIDVATEYFDKNPECKEWRQYDYLKMLKKSVFEYSMVKRYKDGNGEYLSMQLYPRHMEAFIELALDFGIFPAEHRHTSDEVVSYIEEIKTNFPNRVWKYKDSDRRE